MRQTVERWWSSLYWIWTTGCCQELEEKTNSSVFQRGDQFTWGRLQSDKSQQIFQLSALLILDNTKFPSDHNRREWEAFILTDMLSMSNFQQHYLVATDTWTQGVQGSWKAFLLKPYFLLHHRGSASNSSSIEQSLGSFLITVFLSLYLL